MQVIDPLGNKVNFVHAPQRIISLVPSQTELLFDLGLGDQLVGITKYCIHPAAEVVKITQVGGTKNCRLEKIESLHPDLIIANKEENTQSDIETLQKQFPVYVSDITTLDDVYEMILDIGKITHKEVEANLIQQQISSSITSIQVADKKTALYFIWRNPWMTVGADTFIHHMMQALGFVNLAADRKRYPELRLNQIQDLNPAYILLSSEPFPFKQRHIDELQAICPYAKIKLVDGEIFSWYGSRLLKCASYYKEYLQKL
jgi:ABC-type Fe3+-hydroxamate transport system substrate-binding protein